jgi:hypothetical protein
VDFKLENVLVSLHSLKTMGLGSIIIKEWRVTKSLHFKGTYKVRNEIETKRNQRKRNEINKNETKRNEINEMKTK